MEHRIDAALCQHLLRTAQVPVASLVACAEAQRAAKRAGAKVPFLWELLAARGVLSDEALLVSRRAINDPFARAREPVAPAAGLRDPHASATAAPGPRRIQAEPTQPFGATDSVALAQSGEFLPGWGPKEREGVGPGDHLGDYRIERPIGRGSMGSVFQASDQRTGKSVAIKLLAGDRKASRAGNERFWRESRLLCSLQHPNLVRGHGFGTEQGRPYLVMELVRGPSLKHRVRQEGSLTSQDATTVAIHLARALTYLHGEGIIHRDVKPANVLLGPDGAARLCDLGLARDPELPSEVTSSSDTLGTPCYMAPEQARGARDAGPSADLYSLGVTLFHAVAGRPPFEGDSGIVVLSRHLFDEVPDVRSLRPDVAPRLAQAIWRLTRKQPRKRFASARRLLDALQAPALTRAA